MRRATFFSGLMAAALGLGLFKIKHQVQTQEKRLAEIQQEIRYKQEAIHVLKAEWAYLNEPARLQKLALAYLDLRPLQAHQIITFDAIPLRATRVTLETP